MKGVEVKWIQLAKQGDEEVLTRVVDTYYQQIYQYISRLMEDQMLAQDLTQETFIKMLKALPRYDPKRAKFSTWLYTIATNLCRDYWRKKQPEMMETDDLDILTGGYPGELKKWEVKHLVQDALNILPFRQRIPIYLAYVQGMSYEEIGEICRCPVGTVRSRIHYGLKKLRQWFEKMEVSEKR
ncbi:RNA polymerase sigma factor [Anoxybacter fermentans]|uniref:RNA polymerase sigma factor n=1 Tax=Anoxybacter fermentans TaxID=1323375 RepID=UPI0013DF7CD9|nr:RNA polymerase sigma factor [Anoxybacter fermentans]